MKKTCKKCPFKKGMVWHYGAEGKVTALQETVRQGKFSCHMQHPDSNIFSIADMKENDCAGFRMMKENLITKNKHPQVVNGFNETGPDYDLIPWFYHHSNDLEMLKLI